MRVADDPDFDDFLVQLRAGHFAVCKRLLKERQQICSKLSISDLSKWKGAPVLVTTNLAKLSVEEAVLKSLSPSQSAELLRFVALDKVGKDILENNTELFGSIPASKTRNLLTTLFVYPGMDVCCCPRVSIVTRQITYFSLFR
jgi:hypothetical protein